MRYTSNVGLTHYDARERSRDWLSIEHCPDIDSIRGVFGRACDGKVRPYTGLVVVLTG